MPSRRILVLATAILLASAGCGNDPSGPDGGPTVATIEVTTTTQALNAVGATAQFAATARDAAGAALTNVELEWSTSSPGVATVNGSGLVTAVGNGIVEVTATSGGAHGTASLTVQQVVVSVSVLPATWSPTALQATQQFTAMARDANQHPVAGAPIAWHAADDSTISITPAGLATAQLVGNSSVGAVSGSDTGVVAVQVTQLLTTVEVTPNSWQPTALGEEQQLTAVGKDANGHQLTDWSLVWSSTDTMVVRVTAGGLMRSIGAGSATVAGQTSAGSKPVPVLVAQAISELIITPERDTLTALGDTLLLVARASDANGAEITPLVYSWESSDPGVATVSSIGLVTAVTPGVATLSATALGQSAQATITVRNLPPPNVAAIRVSPEHWTASQVGEHQQFLLFATDAQGNDVNAGDVTWESLNPAVASVSSDGKVTALSGGTATVRATVGPLVSTSSVVVDPGGAIANGVVWTMYIPRLIESPAAIAGGMLQTPGSGFQAPWTDDGVAKFQWEAERMGMLSEVSGGQGTFRVRDRVGEWEVLALANAADFQLEGNRIGVRHGDGSVRVKTGIHGAWTVVADGGVAKFQLEGNRIGLLDTNGDFRVRDGLSGTWTTLVSGNATHFQLEGDRIGVLLDDDVFKVKQGIHGAWTTLDAGTAASFALEGNRIALLKTNGELRAKDGISGTWSVLASGGFAKIQLDGNRIGALRANGAFYVKDGLQGAWSTLAASGATDFHLHHDRIGVVLGGTRVRIKTGAPSAPWGLDHTFGAPVTQFHAAVAVPMPPFRTTVAKYQQLHAACLPFDCIRHAYIPFEWKTIPVPFYGRNCGHGRPEDDATSIDGMDYICYNHDRQGSWYAASTSSLGNDYGGACIVRYGLLNARLTRDGTLLTPGTAAYNQAWGLFPETAEAVRRYLNWTLSCTSGYMDDFVQDTRLGL